MSRVDAVLKVAEVLGPDERSSLLAKLIADADPSTLERVPVAWFAALTEIAKVAPLTAGRLASAMYAHLAAHRPESPAPLDAGFEPTAPARDPRV